MPETCALLDSCGFFKKYRSSSDLACKGFIAKYCRGQQMSECKRKQYRQQHGAPPPDEMMPSGVTIKTD
ncbi:MAG: hypothetical protein JXQ73_26005 [Phycisphaerae bacterium]|nr:hypothetical protein [Phycisphaerae bacterium]